MFVAPALILGACAFGSVAEGFSFFTKQTYKANVSEASSLLFEASSHSRQFTSPSVCGETPGDCTSVPIPGLYDDLYYLNLRPFLDPYSSYNEGGVIPSSPDYGACFGPGCEVGNGANIDVADKASISANYNRSRILFFDAKSFYFGCTAEVTLRDTSPGPPEPPVTLYDPSACNLTVKGYRNTLQQLPAANARPLINMTFTYRPNAQPKSPPYPYPRDAAMQLFTLPKTFVGLRTLTFELNKTPVDPDTAESSWGPPAGYLDDISYTVTKLRG